MRRSFRRLTSLSAWLYVQESALAGPVADLVVRHEVLSRGERIVISSAREKRDLASLRIQRLVLQAWSADGQALALLEEGSPAPAGNHEWYRLHVWDRRRGFRTFKRLAPLRRLEVPRAVVWSPDRHRLLLLGYTSQGSADAGLGTLWRIELGSGKGERVAEQVTRANWSRRGALIYWTGSYVADGPTGVARLVERRHVLPGR